jgi:hypothetical protein
VLGHYEARVRQACGVDPAQKSEEMIFRVIKDRWVGGIGIEKRIDLRAGVLAS